MCAQNQLQARTNASSHAFKDILFAGMSMVASSPHPRLFLLPAFLEALFPKVTKREPAGEEG